MPELFIPLVGSYNKRLLGSYDKDYRAINVFHEVVKNPVSGRTTTYLQKRGGTSSSQNDATGVGGPFHIWSGKDNEPVTARLEVAGPNTVHVYVSSALVTGGSVGPFDNGCVSITETLISGTPTLVFVMLHGTTRSYYYYQSGGTLTLINDADFPANTVGEPAFKDGYMFVMDDDGKVHNSDLNSVSAWTSGNYISTDGILDKGTGVVAHKNYIVAFGEKGMELLYNAGNASGSPLSRVQGGAFGTGKISGSNGYWRAHCSFEDVLYWRDHTAAVWAMSTGQPQRVDSTGLNRIGVAVGFQGGFRLFGKAFVVVRGTTTSDGISFLYSVEDQTWTEIQPQWAGSNNYFGEFQQNTSTGNVYAVDNWTGRVWNFSGTLALFTDDSVAFNSRLQTSVIDFGQGKSVTFDRIDVVSDVRSTSGNTAISWTDNDYTSFSTARNVDLSTAQPRLFNCGRSKTGRRAFKITDSVNDAFRIEGLRVFYRVGTV